MPYKIAYASSIIWISFKSIECCSYLINNSNIIACKLNCPLCPIKRWTFRKTNMLSLLPNVSRKYPGNRGGHRVATHWVGPGWVNAIATYRASVGVIWTWSSHWWAKKSPNTQAYSSFGLFYWTCNPSLGYHTSHYEMIYDICFF